MKYLVIALTMLTPAYSLLAQRGAGRDGGSRAASAERRSDMLSQNNDPRFTPFRSVISKKLGKTVRQMVADYDKSMHTGIRLAPEQFVAVHLAAKEAKLDPTVLAANTWRPSVGHGMFAAQVSLPPSPDEFKDQLTRSLMELANMSKNEAEQKAGSSMAAVSPAAAATPPK